MAEDYKAKIKKWAALDRSSFSMRPPLQHDPNLKPVVKGATVVSLFTGAYGLDIGFERAGYDVVLGLDISDASYENFKANRPKTSFIHGDIAGYSTTDILKEADLKPGEVDVVTGSPPCQPFSTAGKREGLKDYRSKALVEFIRSIKEARPKALVMAHTLPQSLYSRTHTATLTGVTLPLITTAEAIMGVNEDIGYINLPPKYLKYIRYVPGGGNWRQVPDELKPEAMSGAYSAGDGRMASTGGWPGLSLRLPSSLPQP